MLKKIISGGQTGADQGGLEAAVALDLESGGTAPWNYMTENGPQMVMLQTYGLVAGKYDSRTYPKRTEQNVKDADATVIFGDVNERGSGLTDRLCFKHKRPGCVISFGGLKESSQVRTLLQSYQDVFWADSYSSERKLRGGMLPKETVERSFVYWLRENDVRTLNVAGNRESKAPGIQKLVKEFLVKTLRVSEVLS